MRRRSTESDSSEITFRRQNQRLRLVLAYFLLLAPWIGIGVVGALQPSVNSPLDWVDSSFEPRSDYDRFCARFGAGDAVVISWPGCTIDEPAVDDFVRSLHQSRGFHEDGEWLFRRVLSGREAYQSLTGLPIGMPPEQARQKLSGTLIGPDGRTTCVMVFFNQKGLHQRSRLVPLIRASAWRYGKAAMDSQHLVGPIMDGYAVDRSSQWSMQRFAPLSSVIAFCMCILCLDGFFTAILVFGLSCLGQAVALAVLYHSGGSMTALLIVIPPLVQVLAISSGVHFVNYYRTASIRHGATQAVQEALRLGTIPCVLSAATTAVGLGSLSVSGLSAVREFGIYAAIGVVANAVLLLSFLPGLLAFPHRLKSSRKAPHPDSHESIVRPHLPAAEPIGWGSWDRLARLQRRFGTAIALAAMLMMLGLGWGTMSLRASVRIETLFDDENRLIQDYAWIEHHVGSMVPIEAVVHFPSDCRLSALDRIALMQRVERRLSDGQSVQAVTSCLGFVPFSIDLLDDSTAPLVLEQVKPWLQQADYFLQDDSGEHWRLTAHLSAMESIDYGIVLQELERSLESDPMLRTGHLPASVEVSGLMPLVHGIQSQLLSDLFASFVTAFLLITLVMTIAEAGLFAGLISMVPNVFPTLTLFGILGWTGSSIDIGSIMTASVAMGIAVDDTLHFLSVFQRQLDRGRRRYDAVRAAYAECGRAMIQTTLICGSGLAVFALSDFVPTARFAWMMVALLLAALVGDLIVLPAFLLSPIGRVFEFAHRPRRRLEWVRDDASEIVEPKRGDRARMPSFSQ